MVAGWEWAEEVFDSAVAVVCFLPLLFFCSFSITP